MSGHVEWGPRLPRIGALGLGVVVDPARRIHRAGAEQDIDFAHASLRVEQEVVAVNGFADGIYQLSNAE